ncbi:MAG: phage portal protein [Erysipelotrichaceae bacterium]
MGVFQTIRKGVRAGMLAIKNNDLNDSRIISLINDFNNSNDRRWMTIGDDYYHVKNDILKREMYKMKNGVKIPITYQANHKLAHPTYKNMVDEKLEYLFAKQYTLKCEDNAYADKVKKVLGKKFRKTLMKLGFEASNKGIGWLHPYIDESGDLKLMVIPSEQCLPIWKDNNHEEMSCFIRVYSTFEWDGNKKQTVTNVEMHTAEGPRYFKVDGKSLTPYENLNFNTIGDKVGYWREKENEMNWGKIPFIPFKNNLVEMPDIVFVKTLVDDYDLTRSEASNFVEDVKNIYWILKGYGKQDAMDFMQMLNEDHAINIEADEYTGVETVSPNMDITSLVAHYEQLKKDILEGGQSINKALDKMGNAPSGVSLKFMYAGLDMKANALETEFADGFDSLLYFINKFYGISDPCKDMELLFNRDVKINETEKIANLNASKSYISEDTYLSEHPYVNDVEKEKAAIKVNEPFTDHINLAGVNETR